MQRSPLLSDLLVHVRKRCVAELDFPLHSKSEIQRDGGLFVSYNDPKLPPPPLPPVWGVGERESWFGTVSGDVYICQQTLWLSLPFKQSVLDRLTHLGLVF